MIPLHSQAVERWVQHASHAALSQVGHKQRHAYLVNLDQNIERYPTNASRSHFSE